MEDLVLLVKAQGMKCDLLLVVQQILHCHVRDTHLI